MYTLNIDPPNKFLKSLFIAFTLLFTVNALALKKDVEKPVHIDADSVVFNKSKGFAVYEGNVSIVQGTLEIKAGKIEIIAPKNEIQKILATGNPVSFKQKMDDGKMAKGSANSFTYLIKEKRIVMKGNARIAQNNDTFSSNYIEYSIPSGQLRAGNKKDRGKSRVKAVFYPSNKTK